MLEDYPRLRELRYTLYRIFKNPSAIIGFGLLFIFTSVAVFAPQIAPPKYAHNPYMMPHKGFSPTPKPPSEKFIFGTTSGQYIGTQDMGNATSGTVTGLSDCTTYYISLKAYNNMIVKRSRGEKVSKR
jgi:hypothetical protein